MNVYGCLDLAVIIISLAGVAFVAEPYTEADALWVGIIVAGFLMWGIHARPRHGRLNLPVRFPPHTPRGILWYGAVSWGILAAFATLIVVWDGVGQISAVVLPAAATMTAWRTCSVYAGRLAAPHTGIMRA